MSRLTLRRAPPPPHPPPLLPARVVGRAQVGVLVILASFLLIFSYHCEIHPIVLGEERSHALVATAAESSSEPLVKTQVHNLGTGVSEIHHTSTRRWLQESQPTDSDGLVDASQSQPTGSSEHDESELSPPPAKRKDWKDMKNEDYQPLLESVQSNVVSSKFQFVIKVLALNDYDSLARCLTSIFEAEYAGDQVDLHIYIDHFEVNRSERSKRSLAEEAEATVSNESLEGTKEGTETSSSNSESPDDSKLDEVPDRVATGVGAVRPSDWRQVEELLAEARRVLNHVESFPWKHGKKVIHYRTRTAGSQSQWLDAWWPSSDDEFALFVEDDAELSPLFYRYARSLIATYYYQPSHYDRLLYGISLQRPQIVPGKNGRPLKVDDRTRLFKYQMVGIWGQIFFPKPWKEFREWYDSRKSHDVKPVVHGMVTTDWYRQYGERMFTPWFVKFAYTRGYLNLYTNFLRDRVLSVTHRDFLGKPKEYQGCDSVLIWENGTYDMDFWHMAANWHIKRYDYCFKEIRAGRFANYSSDVSWVLDSTQVNKQILLVSIMGVPEVMVRNWLCTIRKLGIENYVLVGENPRLLEELARRGHATMRFENKRNVELNIEKEVSVVSNMLNLGHSVWLTRADTIWIGNPLAGINTVGADVIGIENSQLNLFFIRNTKETTTLWGSLDEELSNPPANWDSAREKFIKTCQEGKIQLRTLDEVVFIDGEKLSGAPTVDAGDSVDAQVVVLSELRSLDNYDIKKKISQLDLWNLDGDLVCARLTC